MKPSSSQTFSKSPSFLSIPSLSMTSSPSLTLSCDDDSNKIKIIGTAVGYLIGFEVIIIVVVIFALNKRKNKYNDEFIIIENGHSTDILSSLLTNN